MADTIDQTALTGKAGKRRQGRASIPRTSALERLTPEELQTLRLDEGARTEFDACVQRFNQSALVLKTFEGENVASMDDTRYAQHGAAEAALRSSGMAVVHFMAPRILKMRDSSAKRKWRSFLTKFRREENLL